MLCRLVLCLSVFIGVLSAPGIADAKPLPSCKSPRNTIESLFSWQLGKQQSLFNATRCLEHGGRSQGQLEEAARRLKTVFDSDGAVVVSDKASDDLEFLDADKNARVVVHPRYPLVVIEKRDGRWVWTRESLDWTDAYYEDHLGALDRMIDAIPDSLRRTVGALALWQYIAFVVLFVGGILVSRLVLAFVGFLLRRGQPTGAEPLGLRRRLLARLALPTTLGLFALFVRLVYPELRLPVHVSAGLNLGARLTASVAIFLGAFRFADVFADGLQRRSENAQSRLDDHLIPIVRKALKAASLFVGLLMVLQHVGVDVTAVFATLGIGTLAVGLGAKDVLANLFASFSIFIDNPFKIGDWIHVDGVDGIVEEVGFRSTRLRTAYDSLVAIPNAKLADSKIDNYGKRHLRRVLFTLHPVHGTATEVLGRLCARLQEVLSARPGIEPEKTSVVLTGLGGPSIEVTLSCFFPAAPGFDEPHTKHELLALALDCAGELGVSLHAGAVPAASAVLTERR